MMRVCALVVWYCFTMVTWAQQPGATPKRDPFADFGHTSLDRKPGGAAPTPSAFDKAPPSAATTFAPQTGMATGSGIVLAGNWQGHTSQASGGQTMKLADLRALMENYGKPEPDIAAHPDVTVYEGQRMDGKPGDNCRVTYLMPLSQAEGQLFHSRGMTTASRAVAPGLPDGLFLHTYDIHAGIYTHLVIVTDNARPEPQVVSLVLKASGTNFYPAAPFRKVERDWHTFDYIDTENRGMNSVKIDTRVNDLRGSGHYIVVNTTGRDPNRPLPDVLPAPVVLRPAPWSPKETTTWYVPGPLIRLILYCLGSQMSQQ